MTLEDLHRQFGALLAIEGEHAQLKQSLSVAEAKARDLERRLKKAEKDLKAARSKSTVRLSVAQERWLFDNHATLSFVPTKTGKHEIKLKTGRRADGKTTKLLFDPEEKARAVNEAITVHQGRR